MHNRPTHLAAALPLGTLTAAYKARELNGLQYAAEAVGGALGGAVGGLGPHWDDPPTEAVRFRCLQNTTADPLVRALYGICYALACPISGAPVGFLAGWGAHLALDFGSVRSLGLI